MEIDLKLLERIDCGESAIREMGFGNVRIRIHDEILRLEIDPEQLPKVLEHRTEIIAKLKKLGFSYITLDLEGFRSGSMDLKLKK